MLEPAAIYRTTSWIWEHFEKLDKRNAQCKRCDNILQISGGTKGLVRHLSSKHSIVKGASLNQYEKKDNLVKSGPRSGRSKADKSTNTVSMFWPRKCIGCDEEPGNLTLGSSNLFSKMFCDITGLKGNFDSCRMCQTCQQDLKCAYNFRKRCQEIYNVYSNDSSSSSNDLENNVEQVFVNETVKQEQVEENEDSDSEHNDSFEVDMDQNDTDNEQSFEQSPHEDGNQVPENTQTFEQSSREDDDQVLREPSNRFECGQCFKTFPKRSVLLIHEAAHNNLRNFPCPRAGCTSAFNIITRLMRHMRSVHKCNEDEISMLRHTHRNNPSVSKVKSPIVSRKTESPRVQCNICNKSLSNVKYLKEHIMLRHSKNAPYQCDVKSCGRKFIEWSLFERHQKSHEGIFDYICEFCGKGFVQRNVLNKHLQNSHQLSKEQISALNKKSCICSLCNLSFNTPEKLSEHRVMDHQIGDRFICDMCGKAFVSRVKMISHQKYHQDEKKMQCKMCPSNFFAEKGLKTHLRRVHSLSDAELYKAFQSF